ncbi:VOC family protein [Paenibacillus luteus]|uniref:VOC family protein n=1 Tax=Paenibacillus luteus TaxID=2545753 RepID=UPI001143957D|nr:VOC family protein [Paenibacillus luteus]
MDNKEIIRPKLHHYGLTTTRFEEMKNWYEKVLGMSPTFQSLDPTGSGTGIKASWLTNDNANHRIGIIYIPGLKDDDQKYVHTKIHHVAYEYETLDDLLDSYVRLSEIGIEPVISNDHGASIAFYYRDPDQNIVELNTDTFVDWEMSTEFMKSSPQFAANPNGNIIIPGNLVEARQLGATAAEIHHRAYAGEFSPLKPVDPLVLS